MLRASLMQGRTFTGALQHLVAELGRHGLVKEYGGKLCLPTRKAALNGNPPDMLAAFLGERFNIVRIIEQQIVEHLVEGGVSRRRSRASRPLFTASCQSAQSVPAPSPVPWLRAVVCAHRQYHTAAVDG